MMSSRSVIDALPDCPECSGEGFIDRQESPPDEPDHVDCWSEVCARCAGVGKVLPVW